MNLYKIKIYLSGMPDLNRRPLRPERSALPTALMPVNEKSLPKLEGFLAGATGLEPAIFGLTGRRDNQLRYAPVMFFTLPKRKKSVNMLKIKKQIYSTNISENQL